MKALYGACLNIAITLLASCSIIVAKAGQDTTAYPIIIQFNSIGTGVPADSSLRSFIACFKKKNKVKEISAARIGPMGREGEYWLAFSLGELTKKQAAHFSSQIRVVAERKPDRGIMLFVENTKVDESALGRATIQHVVF